MNSPSYPVNHDEAGGLFVVTPAEAAVLGRLAQDGTVRATSARTGRSERHRLLVCEGAARYWRTIYELAEHTERFVREHSGQGLTEENIAGFVLGMSDSLIRDDDDADVTYPWIGCDWPPPEKAFSLGCTEKVAKTRWGVFNDVFKELGLRNEAGCLAVG